MRSILTSLIVFFSTSVCSQTVIEGNINVPDWHIKYYEPISGFVNNEVHKTAITDSVGNFRLILNLQKSGTVRLYLGGWPILLFMEDGDKIFIKNNNLNSFENLIITGDNAVGHLYYNKFFDDPKLKKFIAVDHAFEEVDVTHFWQELENVLTKSTDWVDSLYKEGKVSPQYLHLAKSDILGTLGWHIGTLIHKEEKLSSNKNIILSKLNQLLKVKNPDILKTPGGILFYNSTYLNYLLNLNRPLLVEEKQLFLSDAYKALQFAPDELQSYLYFIALLKMYKFGASLDYCYAYSKYLELFPKEEDYIKTLSGYDFCDQTQEEDDLTDINFHSTDAENFEEFVRYNLLGRRWYVDLWATWCGPCIQLFKETPSNFIDILKKYDLNVLYISIDDKKDNEKWEKAVLKNQLKGSHFLLSHTLKKSFSDYLNLPIWTIPRFMIISEKGKVLNDNAPSPVDSKIIEEFEKYFGG